MQRVGAAVLIPALIVISMDLAHAQQAGDVGLAMGYPASVAVEWHLADRLAIRPELSLAWTATDFPSQIEGDFENDSFQAGYGISALLYVARWDATRAYVSPRYVYSRRTTEINIPIVGEREATMSSSLVSGSLGVQHRLGDRVSVFGEVGLGYAWSKESLGEIGVVDDEIRVKTFSTRTAAGITFYF